MDLPARKEDVSGEGEIDEIRHFDRSVRFVRPELCSSYFPDFAALGNLMGIEGGVPAQHPAQSNAIDQVLALPLSETTRSIAGAPHGILTVRKWWYGPTLLS